MGSVLQHSAQFHDRAVRQSFITANNWWKYVLLYFPAAVCILLFTYVPGLNPYQYKLVQTEMDGLMYGSKLLGLVFILYYLSYSLWHILCMKWEVGEQQILKTIGYSVRFSVLLLLGAFSESVADNIFPFKIPQMPR